MSDTAIPLPAQRHSRNSGTFDPLYTATQMREYAAQCVAAERERWPDLIRQALLDTADDGDGEYAAKEVDRITERILQGLGPNGSM